MLWFKLGRSQPEDDPSINTQGMDADAEKQRRIALLSGDEYQAFKWFRLGYTARWTAETMLLDRRTAKKLFKSVFRKLYAANAAEICRRYRTVQLQPKDRLPEEDPL